MMEPTLFRDQCAHSCCGLCKFKQTASITSHNANNQHNIGNGVVCVVSAVFFLQCNTLVRTATCLPPHMDTILGECRALWGKRSEAWSCTHTNVHVPRTHTQCITHTRTVHTCVCHTQHTCVHSHTTYSSGQLTYCKGANCNILYIDYTITFQKDVL